jgi:two-component system, sensor histidine kinase and response regulator
MSPRETDHFRILLIDDDEDDFVVLKDLFGDIRGAKYKIDWKGNFDDGLDSLLSGQYDACLLDYRLGEQTGLDLLVAAQKNNVKVPIVFLTGHGDFDLDLRAMQSGAADYLVKGQITAQVLERSVRYAMKHAFDLEELRKSQEQVLRQDRLASLGLLASSLAHEIGTPLGVIRGRAQLASSGRGGGEKLKENMDLIISQIDRISVLVKSLLNLARGGEADNVTSVSLGDVTADIKNLMSHELERKNIQFHIKVDPNFTVRAESGPLSQVFLNLILNSIYAIEEKQKNNSSTQNEVSIVARKSGDQVEIRIQDTGCGISKANLSKLFQPFFTTKDIGVGTGLGLATSYKIVRSWGGKMEVQSQVNEGTTFVISLTAG